MHVFITKSDWDSGEDPVKAVARNQTLEALKSQGGFDGTDVSYHHRRRLEMIEPHEKTYTPSGAKVRGTIWRETS